MNARPGGLARPKASVRPMTMQLVMIRPTYGPSCREMSGSQARSTMSTMITHTAMISVSTIIRTRAGIHFRRIETDRLDMAVAQIRPRHMTTVFVTTLVTASVEQMPRICTNTGLFFPRLSKNAA